jgi:hypothetical protein
MTQLDSQSKDIDGYTYTVSMLDPLAANDLLIDIAHVVGPSLGAGAGAFASVIGGDEDGDGDAMDAKADPMMLDRAISGFFERVTASKMRAVIKLLAGVTRVRIEGNEPFLNDILLAHFQGRFGKMYEWLFFALKVQLGDFFSSMEPVIDRVAPLMQAAVSPSQSSPPTTNEPPTSIDS